MPRCASRTNRRGEPDEVNSDNGGNCVKAEKILQQEARRVCESVKQSVAPEEIAIAEKEILRMVQEEVYPDEMKLFRAAKKKEVETEAYDDKASLLCSRSPFLDADGILRVKGRRDSATCVPELHKWSRWVDRKRSLIENDPVLVYKPKAHRIMRSYHISTMVEIENTVNSRPLTYLPLDREEDYAIL